MHGGIWYVEQERVFEMRSNKKDYCDLSGVQRVLMWNASRRYHFFFRIEPWTKNDLLVWSASEVNYYAIMELCLRILVAPASHSHSCNNCFIHTLNHLFIRFRTCKCKTSTSGSICVEVSKWYCILKWMNNANPAQALIYSTSEKRKWEISPIPTI